MAIPLSTMITSANTHDVTVAIDTVDSIIIERQSSSSTDRLNKKQQDLCLDKAYRSKDVTNIEIIERGYYTTHIQVQKRKNSTIWPIRKRHHCN